MKKSVVAGSIGLVLGAGLMTVPRVQFVTGGALVNLGYFFQDRHDAYDFEHEGDVTPEQVWQEFHLQNELASKVRSTFPRTVRHPLVAMLVCMDSRLDTVELAGDTRTNYYVLRNAGSVIGPEEEEMLELAVNNGVKVVVLTRHSDCAAEKAVSDPSARGLYPALVNQVEHRDEMVRDFLARPAIARKIAAGDLLVKELYIDTGNEHLEETMPVTP